jgi:hypothetical protein
MITNANAENKIDVEILSPPVKKRKAHLLSPDTSQEPSPIPETPGGVIATSLSGSYSVYASGKTSTCDSEKLAPLSLSAKVVSLSVELTAAVDAFEKEKASFANEVKAHKIEWIKKRKTLDSYESMKTAISSSVGEMVALAFTQQKEAYDLSFLSEKAAFHREKEDFTARFKQYQREIKEKFEKERESLLAEREALVKERAAFNAEKSVITDANIAK